MHTITTYTGKRQLGRSTITDHYWSCSCGAKTPAPVGLSTKRAAETEGAFHVREARRA